MTGPLVDRVSTAIACEGAAMEQGTGACTTLAVGVGLTLLGLRPLPDWTP